MLYIENINNNNVRFGNAVGGGSYYKIHPKTLQARKDEIDRIWIVNTETKAYVLNCYLYTDINLDGIVYGSAEDFVVAFNTAVSAGSGVSAPVSATVYNVPGTGTVTGGTKTFSAGTLHSLTITCTVGSAVITVGSETVTIDEGQTMSWEADELLNKDIEIDTSAGGTYSVDYNYIGAPATTTTTTTTAPVTTTTTTSP